MYKCLIICLLLSGCGAKYGVDVEVSKIKSDPIIVKHQVMVDTDKLREFFLEDCKTQYVDQTHIDNCVNEQVLAFLKKFGYTSP